MQTHDSPKPNGREQPYLIFQRDYYNSANSSRAADDGKFEQQLLLSPQLAKLARNDPRFANKNKPIGPRIDLGGGGGIKYIDPPNRKPNNYFYYSENHPRYNKNADFLRPSNKDEKTVKHPYSFDKGSKQSPLGVEIQIGEHRGNAGGIDRTEIRLNNVQNDIDRNDIITTEDLVGRESVQSYSKVVPPPTSSKKEPSLINVYSFTNKHGQKEKVGIIYDQASLRSPQVNNIFDSQKDQIDYAGLENSANVYQSIPINAHQQEEDRSPYFQAPHSRAPVSTGSRAPPNSIPLDRRPTTSARKVYPLGNPRSPAGKSRPDFFKPQPRPPIYKIRPHKLEGVFGPALPPKPQPTRIRLPDDYSTDYRDQRRDSITPTPYQLENIYGKNAYKEGNNHITRPHFRHHHRTNYQDSRQSPRAVRRGDYGVTDRTDVNTRNVVYKRVRDMDYSRPQVILHVKDSGELYVPDPSSEHMPMYDKSPRVEITPGHGTLDEYLERKEREEQKRRQERIHQEQLAIQRQKDLDNQRRAEAERVRRSTTQITTSTTQTTTTISPDAWLADFSDSMPDNMKDKTIAENSVSSTPQRSTKIQNARNNLYRFQPLDLESEPSETVVFRDTDIHRSHSPNTPSATGSFKFPTTPEKQERKPSLIRQFRDVSQLNSNSNDIPSHPDNHHEYDATSNVVTHTRIVETKTESPNAPNYKVVIGLSYDEEEVPSSGKYDYEFEDSNEVVENTPNEKEYSRSELYQICIFEVPDYLKTQLCGGILEGRSQQFINRRSDLGLGTKDGVLNLKKQRKGSSQEQKTHTPLSSVVIPPRPAQLLQEKENVQSISYNIVNTDGDALSQNAAKNLDELSKLKGIFLDKLITKNMERNQHHPPAVIITSNSKVKTYGAVPSPPLKFSVSTPNVSQKRPSVAPILSSSPATTTTTTTQTPWKVVSPIVTSTSSVGVSPATYNTHTPTSSPLHLKPAKPVLTHQDNRNRPPKIIKPQPHPTHPRRRPLLFRKRNKHTGKAQASKPFEYFSRLSQHLGSRLQAPPPQHRRRSTTSPPRIVRQRIRHNK